MKYLGAIKRVGTWTVIIAYVLITMLTDIPHGLWHTFRCEELGRSWEWEEYDTEIGGETYTHHRCSECHYDRRIPRAYL